MKTFYLTGIGIFWTVVVVLGVAGLVTYERQDKGAAQDSMGGPTTQVLNDQAAADAAAGGATVWTLDAVAAHNTTNDCWISVRNGIYNVTDYVPFHPGGEQAILLHCGKEATKAFETKGGTGADHSASAYRLLENYRVAALGDPLPIAPGTTNTQETGTRENTAQATTQPSPAPKPTPAPAPVTPKPQTTTYTTTLVAQHNSVSDCWLIINSKIYNVTQYIPFHPGGTNAIRPWCGKESTQAFTTRGGNGRHSTSAWNQLEKYYLATLGSVAPTSATPVTPAAGTISPVSSAANSYEAAIQDAYPEAVIVSINVEDDGRAEVKFVYEGNTYQAKLDASYNVVEVQED